MKKILFIACLFFASITSNAQTSGDGFLATDFSYSNVGNDYSFYLFSEFAYGSGRGPNVSGVQVQKSNDTVYIRAFYNTLGIWASFYSTSSDTIKYINTDTDVRYFNISSNTYLYNKDDGYPSSDTVLNVHDSTFAIAGAGIASFNNSNALLQLYPNPAAAFITLPDMALSQELRVYNAFGQLLQHQNKVSTTRIDVSSYPAGFYFIALYDKDKQKLGVGKFCKLE